MPTETTPTTTAVTDTDTARAHFTAFVDEMTDALHEALALSDIVSNTTVVQLKRRIRRQAQHVPLDVRITVMLNNLSTIGRTRSPIVEARLAVCLSVMFLSSDPAFVPPLARILEETEPIRNFFEVDTCTELILEYFSMVQDERTVFALSRWLSAPGYEDEVNVQIAIETLRSISTDHALAVVERIAETGRYSSKRMASEILHLWTPTESLYFRFED